MNDIEKSERSMREDLWLQIFRMSILQNKIMKILNLKNTMLLLVIDCCY